jgi:CHAT domain-containing protein/Tfp pilus assembly protein PilF
MNHDANTTRRPRPEGDPNASATRRAPRSAFAIVTIVVCALLVPEPARSGPEVPPGDTTSGPVEDDLGTVPGLIAEIARRDAAGAPGVWSLLRTLAMLHIQLDRAAEAIPVAERAIELAATDPEASLAERASLLVILGTARERTHQRDAAKRAWGLAQELLGDASDPAAVAVWFEAQHGLVRLAEDPAVAVGLATSARARVTPLGDAELLSKAHRALSAALLDAGELDAAREAARESLATLEAHHGPTHRALIMPLSNLAVIELERDDIEAAEALYRRAYAIGDPIWGPDDPNRSAILDNLAQALRHLGRLPEAREALEAAAAIEERRGDAVGLSGALESLSILHRKEGDVLGALQKMERAYALKEGALGADDPEVVATRQILGTLQFTAGRIAEARSTLEAVLAAKERRLGATHLELASTLNNLAVVASASADTAAAESYYRRALAIREASLDPGHNAIRESAGNLGALLVRLGRLSEAEVLLTRALDIARAARGPDHPDVASALAGLGSLRSAAGDLVGARALMEQGIATRERAHGPAHVDLAAPLNNLATVVFQMGDRHAARSLLERVLTLQVERLGPDHPSVATTRQSLALLYLHDGDLDRAEADLERAYAALTATHGPDHPSVSVVLGNQYLAARTRGDLDRAEVLARRELEAAASTGDRGPNTVLPRVHLAEVTRAKGDLPTARALLRDALEIKEAASGPTHPELCAVLREMTKVEVASGDLEAARSAADRSLAIRSAHLGDVATLSEREAIAWLATWRGDLHHWLRLHDRPEDAVDAWAAVLAWKGVAARTLGGAIAAARSGGDPSAALADDLDQTRRRIGALALAADDDPTRGATLLHLAAERDRLERALATTPREVPAAPTPASVRGWLPPGTTLVDVVRLLEDDGPALYIAFVVHDDQVVRVDLGPADPIDQAIEDWRARLQAGNDSRADAAGALVYRSLWAPIAPHLAGSSDVIVIPDGRVAAAPLAALPLPGGRFLVEERTVTFQDRAPTRPPKPARYERGFAAGAIDYGAFEGERTERSTACVADRAFGALPATEAEIGALARRWRRVGAEPLTLLSGDRATESAVSAAMEGVDLVHVATHGYFAQGACRSMLEGGAEGRGLHPMVLSGLALAGAARPPDPLATSDGVLTAEEVTALNLAGVDLVVLSACETGLGVDGADGVLGLGRAFSAAGAGALVTTLWSVDDAATAALMERFYARLFRRGGTDPANALRGAQLELLAQAREYGSSGSSDWGALVAIGPDAWAPDPRARPSTSRHP